MEQNDQTAKILLAEDDTDMRRFLVKALQTAGFEVISYDNGMSAYQRLREEPFQLLLTDIVMPEMDGIELARRAAPGLAASTSAMSRLGSTTILTTSFSFTKTFETWLSLVLQISAGMFSISFVPSA